MLYESETENVYAGYATWFRNGAVVKRKLILIQDLRLINIQDWIIFDYPVTFITLMSSDDMYIF